MFKLVPRKQTWLGQITYRRHLAQKQKALGNRGHAYLFLRQMLEASNDLNPHSPYEAPNLSALSLILI